MPLVTDERTAIQILSRELAARFGETDGINSWARTVLGAHGEQARRLTHDAHLYRSGDLDLDAEYPATQADSDVTVTRTVEDRELSITLKADRLPITSFEELVDFYEIDTERWRPTRKIFNFWGSDANPNFQVKANFEEIEYKGLTAADRDEARDFYKALALEQSLLRHPEDLQPASDNGHLLEIVVSDLHADAITTAGTSLQDHLTRAREAVGHILARGVADGVERIALVFLGDTFNDEGTGYTTAGTPQASYGPSRDSYRKIRDFIGELATSASRMAPVDLYVLSGNHDRERAFYVVDSLYGLLSQNDRVTVHTDVDRNAIDWGVNLIGIWHGERQKPTDIAMTLMREFDTRDKRILEVHLGHEHTRREDEIHGVLLRRFRTPTPTNEWHEQRLFNHNTRSVTGILWDRARGEIASYPHTFLDDV